MIDLDKVWSDMRVLGNLNNDALGCAVASRDVNGHGFMDIIIGAYQADPGIPAPRTNAGEVYVIYGLAGRPATFDLNATPADITIYGNLANDETGCSVASGDINTDGFYDIIIGAPYADPGTPARTDAGETYLIAGGGAIITAHRLGGKSWLKAFSLLGRDYGSFKSASVGAGLPNLYSFYWQTDVPQFMESYFGGPPWEEMKVYLDHSAMYHIGKAVAPTLIQHGAEDQQVPLSQSKELYQGLKRNNVPVEFVIYPRQPHGIREPKLRKDAVKRNLDWFNKWLRGVEEKK